MRPRFCRALRRLRLTAHVILHRVPLSDRLAVALAVLVFFTLCGEHIDIHRIIDVVGYAICETVAHLTARV